MLPPIDSGVPPLPASQIERIVTWLPLEHLRPASLPVGDVTVSWYTTMPAIELPVYIYSAPTLTNYSDGSPNCSTHYRIADTITDIPSVPALYQYRCRPHHAVSVAQCPPVPGPDTD